MRCLDCSSRADKPREALAAMPQQANRRRTSSAAPNEKRIAPRPGQDTGLQCHAGKMAAQARRDHVRATPSPSQAATGRRGTHGGSVCARWRDQEHAPQCIHGAAERGRPLMRTTFLQYRWGPTGAFVPADVAGRLVRVFVHVTEITVCARGWQQRREEVVAKSADI